MAEIKRSRILRPSTRKKTSKSYKIDTAKVGLGDILVVEICHETKSFHQTYRFKGKDVLDKKSIHFSVEELGTEILIKWSGIQPIAIPEPTIMKLKSS